MWGGKFTRNFRRIITDATNERTKFNSRIEKRICNWSPDYRGYFLPVTVSGDHVLKCTEPFPPEPCFFSNNLTQFSILYLYFQYPYFSNKYSSNRISINISTRLFIQFTKIKLTLTRIYRIIIPFPFN